MANQDCKTCSGTGRVVVEKEGVTAAERCACVAESQSENAENASQIPANHRAASFETFHLPQDNPMVQRGLVDAMLAVSSYARLYPDTPKPGVLLVGAPGTEETHLGCRCPAASSLARA